MGSVNGNVTYLLVIRTGWILSVCIQCVLIYLTFIIRSLLVAWSYILIMEWRTVPLDVVVCRVRCEVQN